MAEKTLTKTQFANHIKVSRQMVSRYAQHGMPTTPDGRVVVRKATAWLRQNIGGKGNDHVGTRSETLTSARARKERALASLRELEFRERAGELVNRAETDLYLSGLVVTARDALLRIPDELQIHIGIDNAERVRGRIEAVLTQLSRYDETL